MATETVSVKPRLREIDRKLKKDARVLERFTSIYCDHHHRERERTPFIGLGKLEDLAPHHPELCRECSQVLAYSLGKLLLCPHHPKPACKHCPSHCYATAQREQMRAIMRFSGKYLVTHGRFDLLFKLLF